MNKYTKPTISLLPLSSNTLTSSTCSTSTTDAKMLQELLEDMGIPKDQAFATGEGCAFPFDFEDYCKFTSAIQVFFS